MAVGLHRSESRNSVVSNGGTGTAHPRTPTGGVSIAGMGTAYRRPSSNLYSQRPASRGPPRRGSVTYITQENDNAGKTALSFCFLCLLASGVNRFKLQVVGLSIFCLRLVQ